jgi:hypothetical protein
VYVQLEGTEKETCHIDIRLEVLRKIAEFDLGLVDSAPRLETTSEVLALCQATYILVLYIVTKSSNYRRVWIGNWFYCTRLQLVTTFHKSLSQKE